MGITRSINFEICQLMFQLQQKNVKIRWKSVTHPKVHVQQKTGKILIVFVPKTKYILKMTAVKVSYISELINLKKKKP